MFEKEPIALNINGTTMCFDTDVDKGIVCNDYNIMVEIKYLTFDDALRRFSELGLPDDFIQNINTNHINNLRLYSHDGSSSILMRGYNRSYQITYTVNNPSINIGENEIIIGAFESVDAAYGHLKDFVSKLKQCDDYYLPKNNGTKFAFKIRESVPVLLTIIWHDGNNDVFKKSCQIRKSRKYVSVEYSLPLQVITQGKFVPYLNTEEIFMLATYRTFTGNTFFNEHIRFNISESNNLRISAIFQLSKLLNRLERYFDKAVNKVTCGYFIIVRYFDSLCEILYWTNKFGQCFEIDSVDNLMFLTCNNKVFLVIIPFRGVWWLIALSDDLQNPLIIREVVSAFYNTPYDMVNEALNGLNNDEFDPDELFVTDEII